MIHADANRYNKQTRQIFLLLDKAIPNRFFMRFMELFYSPCFQTIKISQKHSCKNNSLTRCVQKVSGLSAL